MWRLVALDLIAVTVTHLLVLFINHLKPGKLLCDITTLFLMSLPLSWTHKCKLDDDYDSILYPLKYDLPPQLFCLRSALFFVTNHYELSSVLYWNGALASVYGNLPKISSLGTFIHTHCCRALTLTLVRVSCSTLCSEKNTHSHFL